MEYIMKSCPICGGKFVVMEDAANEAVYCTLECLSKAEKSMNKVSMKI
ncbi:hypothetical protein Metev_2318 (plasmid) [Methanohalobium evestigatum Z-7303]|uniref:Uncharacterized protein n=1 Tax=Methanohalobium evestigatum (strain ATCC BAA-1072 / DSM 3721 / NBRC 107634 / OCM 161 / Z-7303) TaxID=644295 RepID=D7EC08_METEZ|nr:hypothetical protein [Methanohalobium evestigatum]ADI75130.1 hypothetical protein Metev_2318 [Methanohalobium evestigatum Z-7303]